MGIQRVVAAWCVCADSLGSGCVFPNWVGSSMDFSLAQTSLCFREGWFLYMQLLGILEKCGLALYYF